MPTKKPIIATLVRGSTFFMRDRDKPFLNGVPAEITAEQRCYLEQHAVDEVVRAGIGDEGEDEIVTYQKFKFSEEAPDERPQH